MVRPLESPATAIVIGAGPAGLMAAEVLAAAGARVEVYDAMPSAGRKFLLAGRGGLNLTHSEPLPAFLGRYDVAAQPLVQRWLGAVSPQALRDWAQGLGVQTFVGTSGRVFPQEMKAAPLLRAWMARLRAAGVQFHMRHRWLGWTATSALLFASPQGQVSASADAVVLALGGASWARLGSDGAWVPLLRERGVGVNDLMASNCGFDAQWTPFLRERHAGEPVKAVAARVGQGGMRRGEFILTASGVEGGLVYALSAALREQWRAQGYAEMRVDLLPQMDADRVAMDVAHPRGARSWSSHLQSRLNLKGVKMALLRECAPAEAFNDPAWLARCIKDLPLRLSGPRPIDEAISSAGGVRLDEVDEDLQLRRLPGVFCTGEMLDWDAPTGGYLLTACFAGGAIAGAGAAARLGLTRP
ncbi:MULTISPECIES: TIGR03862 family flavoprotein [unclassified Achromobacter]|uniref:TIGR03862 family flavoprotein n=1 Tax=unclassified Achromobacter TaxID=2626865 RepID=UPI000B518C07|nr:MULTISPECIES: TIGR03862 family flavoprotein [unclassified Achromobacter]OWT77224.1 aminoacetone oxidase family FAD-binding enzyme [Achromobacter sp. HZ28]OWT78105.1 aminoacetone oxidase family FAD-binding enzyme [Achromobacter sp. HZ34]